MNTVNTQEKTSSIPYVLALIGIMTALSCVLAPLSLPIGPVPISLTNLVIYLSIYILGMKRGTISYLVYLLIGLIGLPVFSGFTGGAGKLFGPTGGYLIGFIPMAIVAGIIIDRFRDSRWKCFLGMVLGTLICYLFGTVWLAYQANMDFKSALFAGVIPFIPGDLIKMAVVVMIAPQIRSQLKRAHLL